MTGTAPRAAILEAALEVLYIFGYRGFTIEAVADRAGVDRAAIDGSWTDLLIDVLAEAMTIPTIPTQDTSREELRLAVLYMATFGIDRQRVEPTLLAFAADHAGDEDVLEQLRQRCIRRSREQIGAIIRRAVDRGDLPPDVDSDLMQDVWAGAIAYRRVVTGDSLDADLVESMVDMVLSGTAPLRQPDWPTGRPPIDPSPWWLPDSAEWLYPQAFGHVLPLDRDVPVKALGAIRPTVTIAGHDVTIEAGAWRDFMPLVTETSTALMVAVMVTAAGSGVLPPFLRADRIAVLHDDEVWVAPLVEENPRARTSRSFQVMARSGPQWEPGSSVDIVVALRGEQATMGLVRAGGRRIQRTD